MRFKAKVSNSKLFQDIVQTLEKVATGHICVIHLSAKKVQFIIAYDQELQVWSGINQGSLFSTYKIESKHGDEIAFNINLTLLLKSLKSSGGDDIFIKLTKKDDQPYLSFVIGEGKTTKMVISQDVPIELIAMNNFNEIYKEPPIPEPKVSIMMPLLKSMISIVDRMKNISDHITIHANMAGAMSIITITECVSITTFFTGLHHPNIEGRSPPRHDPDIVADAKVDIKNISKFLNSRIIQPDNVICCIIENQALVLHVLKEDLYITYYIPVIEQ